MKTFVYFSLSGHGHVNPTLPVIRELVKKGNTVYYYSLTEFKEKIEATGAIFRSYPEEIKTDIRLSKNVATLASYVVDATFYIIPRIQDQIVKDKVDVIMFDTFALWGKALSTSLDIPSIAFNTTIAFNGSLAKKYFRVYFKSLKNIALARMSLVRTIRKYRKLAKIYNFKPGSINELLFNKGDMNIVFTSSYFQPCKETFDDSFKFYGPSLFSLNKEVEIIKKIQKKKKVIYISAGTIFNDSHAFFLNNIAAFGNTDYQVIMSIGHRFTQTDFPNLPDNIMAMNHVPQLEILQKTDLFVTHAGMNSINESLYYGVPMILIPQIHEQTINAMRVQELGAGVFIKGRNVTSTLLATTAEKILTDKSFYLSTKKIQESLHTAGGYKKAAQGIIEFARR